MSDPIIKCVRGLDYKITVGSEKRDAVYIADTGDRTVILTAQTVKDARKECAAIFGMLPHEFDVIN
jgi:hypothetical protein